MRIIEQKIYKFNELSLDIQKTVVNDFIEKGFFDIDNLTLEDIGINYLSELNLPCDKLYYSLSYSQGDGVSFIGTFNKEQKISLIEKIELKEDLKKVLLENLENISLDIVRNNLYSYRYSHEFTMNIEIDYLENLEDFMLENYSEIENAINKYIRTKAVLLADILYKEIESYKEFDYIKECIISNEYEFYENGKLF